MVWFRPHSFSANSFFCGLSDRPVGSPNSATGVGHAPDPFPPFRHPLVCIQCVFAYLPLLLQAHEPLVTRTPPRPAGSLCWHSRSFQILRGFTVTLIGGHSAWVDIFIVPVRCSVMSLVFPRSPSFFFLPRRYGRRSHPSKHADGRCRWGTSFVVAKNERRMTTRNCEFPLKSPVAQTLSNFATRLPFCDVAFIPIHWTLHQGFNSSRSTPVGTTRAENPQCK